MHVPDGNVQLPALLVVKLDRLLLPLHAKSSFSIDSSGTSAASNYLPQCLSFERSCMQTSEQASTFGYRAPRHSRTQAYMSFIFDREQPLELLGIKIKQVKSCMSSTSARQQL